MLRVQVQLFGDEQKQRRDRYKVASVVYKNQRNTYTYKLSKASPPSSLHDKMGEKLGRTDRGRVYKPLPHPTPP